MVDLAMKHCAGKEHLRLAVEKELLQYDILFALHQSGFLRQGLVFQGGTLLRLCYGSVRFSEDLDFAGGGSLMQDQFAGIRECIESYVGSRYGLAVTVKDPKKIKSPSADQNVHVLTWRITIETVPSRPDIRRQRIKLDIADVQAYTKEALTLRPNYTVFPAGYSSFLILAESKDEVLADKLIALPASLPRVRYKDIWDIPWLARTGATARPDLVSRKIEDYRVDDYRQKLDMLLGQVADLATSEEYKQAMRRQLPSDVYANMVDGELAASYHRTFLPNLLEEFKSKL